MLRMKLHPPSVAISGWKLIQMICSGAFIIKVYYRAEVSRSHEDHDPHHVPAESTEDIGGDMNHIHRVTLQLYEDNLKESKGTVVTVIVKTAPDEVLVCPLE